MPDNGTKQVVPQGILKILNIADIKVTQRYRVDFGDLEALAETIKDKGVLQPITVYDNMQLLAGERRLRAAALAGLTKIPALVRRAQDIVDAREIELIENIYRQDFAWPEQAALIKEIDRLYKEKHIEWLPAAEGGALKPGWSSRRTAELLGKGATSVARAIQLANAVEVIPELAEYKTAADALKVISKMEEQAITHELRERQTASMSATGAEGLEKGIKAMLVRANTNYAVGDTFKGLAELRSGGNINVIECDPPYGIDLTELKGSKDSVDSNVHSYNEIPKDKYEAFLATLASELFRVAAPHSWLVFWFGPTWHTQVLAALRKAGWLVDDIPQIWTKRNGQTMQPEIYLARSYEPFFLARKGQPLLVKRGRLNVFDFPGTPSAQKYHPTERPVALIEDILVTLGLPMQTVLVPFLGSGATIRAAYNLGMKVFGWDKSPEYKDRFMLAVEQDARQMTAQDDADDEAEC